MTTPAYDSLSELQQCEPLARAMGIDFQRKSHLTIGEDDPTEWHWISNREGWTTAPNPFTSADDYRALRLWARVEGIVIRHYLHCVLAWPSLEEFMSDENSVQVHHDPRFKDREVDYDAECRADAKAIGRVLGLWT